MTELCDLMVEDLFIFNGRSKMELVRLVGKVIKLCLFKVSKSIDEFIF